MILGIIAAASRQAIRSTGGGGGGGSDPFTVAIYRSRASAIAPALVTFRASITDIPGVEIARDCYVQWDFGDSGAGDWTTGALKHSKNLGRGPWTGHVYDDVGTYTVTCTVVHATGTVSTSVSVTVTDADTAFAGTKTVCVSTSGDFTGAPAGCTQVTSSSIATALGYITTGGTVRRVLFRGGETFTATNAVSINAQGPGHIGSFGTGKAILKATGSAWVSSEKLLRLFGHNGSPLSGYAPDWRMVDLSFTSDASVAPRGTGAIAEPDDWLVYRCDFDGFNVGVEYSVDNLPFYSGRQMPQSMGIVECTFENTAQVTSWYGAYWSGIGCYAAGNSFDGNSATPTGAGASGGYETSHAIRIPTFAYACVEHNDFQRVGRDRHVIKMHSTSDESGSVFEGMIGDGHSSYYANVYSNNIAGNSQWMMYAAPTNSGLTERITDVLIHSNFFTASTPMQHAVYAHATRVWARNNIVDASASVLNNGAFRPLVMSATTTVPDDVRIEHNTIYSSGTAGFTGVNIGAGCTGSYVRNNLMYAPSASSPTILTDSGTGTTAATNTTNLATDPSFVGPLTGYAGFAVGGGSYAKAAGTAIAIYRDIDGTARSGSAPTIGAHE